MDDLRRRLRNSASLESGRQASDPRVWSFPREPRPLQRWQGGRQGGRAGSICMAVPPSRARLTRRPGFAAVGPPARQKVSWGGRGPITAIFINLRRQESRRVATFKTPFGAAWRRRVSWWMMKNPFGRDRSASSLASSRFLVAELLLWKLCIYVRKEGYFMFRLSRC